jgi:hypothetical protein
LYGATDRLTKAQIRKSIKTKELVAVVDSLRWKGEDHVARMDQRRWTDTVSVWYLRIGDGEMGDRRPSRQTHSGKKQEDSGHEQAKTDANGANSHNICKSTSLGTAHLVIKHSNSLWFHQKAVGFMGIIRIICSFIYLVCGQSVF